VAANKGGGKMNFFQKLQQLDRRWIYLILAIAIILPLIFPFNSTTYTTRYTEDVYKMIDSFAPTYPEGITDQERATIAQNHDRAVLLVFSFDASTMPELYPMVLALLRHCFERDVKVFTLTFFPTAAPIIDLAINTVKESYSDIRSGVHYANFGYKVISLYLPIVLQMGEDVADAIDIDAEGRKISSLPIMTNIKNYNEMNLVIELSGSSAGGYFITYARPRFGVNVAVGVTAVMAADEYPYLQTGQFIGMLAGLKGAAEYEKLVDVFATQQREFSKETLRQIIRDKQEPTITDDERLPYAFRQARIGMNAQSIAHILIIVFILIGNIGYFIQKYMQKKENK
jgi:hypothetical protein